MVVKSGSKLGDGIGQMRSPDGASYCWGAFFRAPIWVPVPYIVWCKRLGSSSAIGSTRSGEMMFSLRTDGRMLPNMLGFLRKTRSWAYLVLHRSSRLHSWYLIASRNDSSC